jgi:hypothetical protein
MTMDKLAGALDGIEILDQHGQPQRIGALWAERPVVLLFVRHFG